ncbi:MAG TPA: hydrogenase 3 maturation endopeptidase HyCI [Phycisphaerales bacterium]|nr:hydrogenase 3 maturation endopeptidase HyCI [Phycisphaerales bacterium]
MQVRTEHPPVDAEVLRFLADRTAVLPTESIVILGVGQTLKGDDGAGPVLCERIRNRVAAHVIDAGTIPENYVQPIVRLGPRLLLIVDASDFGAPPGTIALLAPERISRVSTGTHGLSPRLFVDLIRRQVETECWFLAIQPQQIRLGEGLSPPIRGAVDRLAQALIGLLG